MANLCPICGAYSPRSCEMLDEGGGECLWEVSGEYQETGPYTCTRCNAGTSNDDDICDDCRGGPDDD